MKSPTPIYNQILTCLRQYSFFTDLRHVKTLAAMVTALLSSQKLTLSEWEPHIPGQALQAQSYERRWQRFFYNPKINVEQLYIPLVLAALSKYDLYSKKWTFPKSLKLDQGEWTNDTKKKTNIYSRAESRGSENSRAIG